MKKTLVIHGPNLNLLGLREPGIYGGVTLKEIDEDLKRTGQELGVEVGTFQSYHEGEIVVRIQAANGEGYAAIVINPAGYTHTSIAIRDALAAVDLPFFEVHISNIHAREPFRRKSLLSDLASGIVAGFGPVGYRLALLGAHDKIKSLERVSGEEEN